MTSTNQEKWYFLFFQEKLLSKRAWIFYLAFPISLFVECWKQKHLLGFLFKFASLSSPPSQKKMKYCSFENVNPRQELFASPAPHLLMASGITSGCYPPFTPYFRAQAVRTSTAMGMTSLCNFPDTCTSGETQNSEVIYYSFEKLKGVKTGYSHQGSHADIKCFERMIQRSQDPL